MSEDVYAALCLCDSNDGVSRRCAECAAARECNLAAPHDDPDFAVFRAERTHVTALEAELAILRDEHAAGEAWWAAPVKRRMNAIDAWVTASARYAAFKAGGE